VEFTSSQDGFNRTMWRLKGLLKQSKVSKRTIAPNFKRFTTTVSIVDPDPLLIDVSNAPSGFDPSSAVVYNDFISVAHSDSLIDELHGQTRRRRYEKGHWDAVITDYKEIELNESSLEDTLQRIVRQVRNQLTSRHFSNSLSHDEVQWLPPHGIDLKLDGELKAHVDSVRFSGDLVAGISLLSSSIMRLKPEIDGSESISSATEEWVDLYLPPRSLYVLSGMSRYEYTHELLPSGSIFRAPNGEEIQVDRDRRFSVIFRDAKSR
jgi:alkylated DNA repair protein alkB family protein 7